MCVGASRGRPLVNEWDAHWANEKSAYSKFLILKLVWAAASIIVQTMPVELAASKVSGQAKD